MHTAGGSFVQGLKEGDGATVFDFERVLAEASSELPPPPEELGAVVDGAGGAPASSSSAARKGGGAAGGRGGPRASHQTATKGDDSDGNEPRSQAQMNKAAVELLDVLPSFGAEFAPIFNHRAADTDVDSRSAGCEEVGAPVPGEGLRQQVELAHPDAARRCNKENGKGVFNPWSEEEDVGDAAKGGGIAGEGGAGGGATGGGGGGKKKSKQKQGAAGGKKERQRQRDKGQRLVKGVYGFFNALILAVCGDDAYEASEVSLLRSLPGCPRQAGHGDYPIDVMGSEYLERPHFSLLVPACDMPAHLWLWPGSHRLMEQVLNSNSERGQHAAGADFYIGSLQRLAGMKLGKTIAPEDIVVGGGQACAFLGHVVHAGAESQCAVATHYRWHCYVQRKGTSKEDNSANGLPRGVSAICSDSLRMVAAGLHDE